MTKEEIWARRQVRALIKRLLEQLAREHERAAEELRRAAK